VPTEVLILGAGFGGLELSTRLAEDAPDDVHVTLVDKSDSFAFGYSKLDVMFGHSTSDEVKAYYRDIARPNVEFRQESVHSIDPSTRRVVTDASTYEPDILVVALGADVDPSRTPGLVEGGHEFYTRQGADDLRDVLDTFSSGTVLISVLGPFFKCPPAPYECAFMLHDALVARGVRDACRIHVLTSLGAPIPVSPETSAAIIAAFDERGIELSVSTIVSHLDPETKTAFHPGGSLPYDLFLGIPIHHAPNVVVQSGLTDDGWIAVDPATFATRFPGIYAVGDITSAPVPRAGTVAESEASTVADVLIAQLRGGPAPEPYKGRLTCYMEMGKGLVGKVNVSFMEGPSPVAHHHTPSAIYAEEKHEFGASRLRRWFGYDVS
jgi:sulfide:quinone oxidoreductase